MLINWYFHWILTVLYERGRSAGILWLFWCGFISDLRYTRIKLKCIERSNFENWYFKSASTSLSQCPIVWTISHSWMLLKFVGKFHSTRQMELILRWAEQCRIAPSWAQLSALSCKLSFAQNPIKCWRNYRKNNILPLKIITECYTMRWSTIKKVM